MGLSDFLILGKEMQSEQSRRDDIILGKEMQSEQSRRDGSLKWRPYRGFVTFKKQYSPL